MSVTVIARDQHNVSRKLMSPNALKVISRLNNSGFEAYLVGGGVRDILLGGEPKDFDIATDAHPEQVHELFRNSRLIGRRFKLVHILFGREVIEVATFRGAAPVADGKSHKQSDQGMLLRDNVYGSMEDDALRRDFTANALYYSSKDFAVYDYVGAMADIKSKTLRLIGDPETRYREDPVRMLRAIRFKAKLGFTIEEQASHAIYKQASLIESVAAARLFDEIIKLFVCGKGEAAYYLLREYELFRYMFPAVTHTLDRHDDRAYYEKFIVAGLRNTDIRIQADKPITPAFLYAVILWPEVDRLWQKNMQSGLPEFPALQQASQQAVQDQLPFITIPKRFTLMMKEIWELQIRLKKTSGKWPHQLIEHKRFRAAYDFLLLRELAGKDLDNLGNWWTDFQKKNPVPARTSEHRSGPRPNRKRNNRNRGPKPA